MQTIKTNGREIVAVEVPAYASEFYLSNAGYLCHKLPTQAIVYTEHKDSILLPTHKIIGLLSESIAEQIMPRYSFQTFRAWLQCKGVDITKPLLIIEKIK